MSYRTGMKITKKERIEEEEEDNTPWVLTRMFDTFKKDISGRFSQLQWGFWSYFKFIMMIYTTSVIAGTIYILWGDIISKVLANTVRNMCALAFGQDNCSKNAESLQTFYATATWIPFLITLFIWICCYASLDSEKEESGETTTRLSINYFARNMQWGLWTFLKHLLFITTFYIFAGTFYIMYGDVLSNFLAKVTSHLCYQTFGEDACHENYNKLRGYFSACMWGSFIFGTCAYACVYFAVNPSIQKKEK